jgi:hypothetical protein
MIMSVFSESFNATPLAASGPVSSRSVRIGGFLASTAGTIQLRNGPEPTSPILVASLPVVAGQFVPMPFAFSYGLYVELGGGATGTIASV